MEDNFPHPYRFLIDSTSSNSSSSGRLSYDILELENINASWQPIYLALFLTMFQCAFFLTIFEWGRRNKYISSVFDRRRLRHPTRTPAPLMKQKGCANGWLAFEWWKIRITDEDYQKDSWDEFRLLKMEEDTKNTSQPLVLAGEEHDPYMLAAENACYRESPFFELLEKKQNDDLEMGYGRGNDDQFQHQHQLQHHRSACRKPKWRPKPLEVASNCSGDSVISDDYLSMAEMSCSDDERSNSDGSNSSSNSSSSTAQDGDKDRHVCAQKAGHTETTVGTSTDSTTPVTIEYDAAREMAGAMESTGDLNAGNNALDYGYGEDNDGKQPDYGYGDTAEDTLIQQEPSFASGSLAAAQDYGYGYNCNETAALEQRQVSTQRSSSNSMEGTSASLADQRLTLFTGGMSSSSSPSSAPSPPNQTKQKNPKLDNTSSTTVPKFNLDDILGNVTASKPAAAASSSRTSAFSLDNITAPPNSNSNSGKSQEQPFRLDNVTAAPIVRNHHTENDNNELETEPAAPATPFSLDNIVPPPRTRTYSTDSGESIERRMQIEAEIQAVEARIHSLKRRMSDDTLELPKDLLDDDDKNANNDASNDSGDDKAPDNNDDSPSDEDNDFTVNIDSQDEEESHAEAETAEESQGETGGSYDLCNGGEEDNAIRLVPMKQEGDEGRPMVRRSRRPPQHTQSFGSDPGFASQRALSLDGAPTQGNVPLTIGGSEHLTTKSTTDMDYGYESESVDSSLGGTGGGGFARRGGETYNRRSSGGEAFNRRSSGGEAYSRRTTEGGASFRRKSGDGNRFRRKSGDGGLKRGLSMKHGDITVDPRSTLTATSATMTNFVKNRVLMMNDDSEDSDDDDELRPNSGFVATKITKRKLSAEDQELLRCIGLDSFMTLRFIQFGFDTAFWPMVLSCITLIPICKTAGNGVDGFFSTTVVALNGEGWRYWAVVFFGILHFGYILRRIWIEWEVFLPLRYEFLENGDFEKEKYKEQYRKTCLIEYIPKAQKHDKSLYDFFDAVSPGEIQRAEVLLNTEHLRYLIRERMKHLISYEDVYAQKVHARKNYLRDLEEYEQLENKTKCFCMTKKPPVEPMEPTCVARQRASRDPNRKVHLDVTFSETRRAPALKWHYENIQRLNKEIDDEYMRLAQAQRRPVTQSKENRLSKWLGIKYLTGSDTGRLHSSTAFVQFKTLSAKQHAIQCNITGMHNYLTVTPVPEVRDIIWDNMHVSRALIETRKAWINVAFTGGLIAWSMIVAFIRSYNDLSKILNSIFNDPLTADPAVSAFLDFYAPALIVEGLVRAIPNIMKVVVIWVRFKAHSERDHYILRWYFGYRLLTFLFIIIGGTLVNSSNEFVQDPIGFFKKLSGNIALNAQFFVSYVIVSGGVQVFFRLSQWHNLALYYLMKSVQKAESMSQRKIQNLTTKIQVFHLDEFIPLFIFIFMVGALYGTIAPLSNFFVAGFYYVTYKVFKYMTLFVYGNHYEGGGFLFYTISQTLFYVMYMIILLLVFFFSVNGSSAVAGVFSMLLLITYYVQNDVQQTFVEPSKTLSLAKSRGFDEQQDTRSTKEKRQEEYMKAKKAYDEAVRKEEMGCSDHSMGERLRLLPRTSSHEYSVDSFDPMPPTGRRGGRRESNMEKVTDAVQAFNDRYNGDEHIFDDTDEENPSNKTGQSADFFIYRQPSLNKATWEMAPKPYREGLEREEAADIWGDIRPEQTRKVARQRRASIAMYYGG